MLVITELIETYGVDPESPDVVWCKYAIISWPCKLSLASFLIKNSIIAAFGIQMHLIIWFTGWHNTFAQCCQYQSSGNCSIFD